MIHIEAAVGLRSCGKVDLVLDLIERENKPSILNTSPLSTQCSNGIRNFTISVESDMMLRFGY